MPIDKEIYKEARKLYQLWDEAVLLDRVRNAGNLSPEEAWNQYQDLWQFVIRLSPGASAGQRKQRFMDMETYNAKILKLEVWRQNHVE